MKPIVAIVGRPNVGKSTFFNRITRSKDAIVDNLPGVTRDRNYGDAIWNDIVFTLVDTGGFLICDKDDFTNEIHFQVFQAIEDADVIILLMDGKAGRSPYDRELIEILHKTAKSVFYVVNKIDSLEQEANIYDFYSLGIKTLYPVSAEHRFGIHNFLDDLILALPKSDKKQTEDIIKLSVIGRPNVGKSSLINQILNKKRLLVSDIPGTTRDAIDSVYNINEKPYLLIDTAGIRRKGKVSKKIEKFSIIKALKSLDRCDIALILMDVNEGITDQDINIAGYAFEKRCGCIILLNKWDLVEKDSNTLKTYYEQLRIKSKFLSFAPVITISALTGLRVQRIFTYVDEVYRQYIARIKTGQLNNILQLAIKKTEPSLYQGKRLKFYYAAQLTTKPPTFVCVVNYPDAVHFSYKRYLINQIREQTMLDKTPIRLLFRPRKGRISFGREKR